MSLDITSETVTIQGGTIILEGTGLPGQIVDIYVNGNGPLASATVDANGVWTTPAFDPTTAARRITVRAVVRGSTTGKDRTEIVTMNPATLLAELNKEVKQKGAKTRRVKATAVTIHRGKKK